MSRSMYNIHMLGIGFMFIFSAFTSAVFMESIVFKDYNKRGIGVKTGFYSLAIVYSALGVSNWFAPAIVKKLGTKLSLFLSVLPNVGFIFCMYEPYRWSVFLFSAFLGMGGGVLWTANGEVIAKNSPGDTKVKNTGIFWVWFNMSNLLGNTFLYFELGNADTISDSRRHLIYIGLGVFSVIGMLFFLFQKPTEYDEAESIEPLLQPIKDGIRFSKTWQMGLLYGPIVFTGLSINFWGSVFVVVLGNVFPKRSYLALAGICLGAGQVIGGFIWSLLSYKLGKHGVIVLCTVINCATYYTVFISFPVDAATTVASVAEANPIIASNIYLALFLAVLLGLGDGGFNVCIYASLGTIYERKPAPAFAVFKFVQGIMATAAFLYCGTLLLPYQLLILSVACLAGCVTYIALERCLVTQTDNKSDSEDDTLLINAVPEEYAHLIDQRVARSGVSEGTAEA